MTKIFDLDRHDEPFVTVEELATYWRVSRRDVERMIKDKALSVSRHGIAPVITIESARAYQRMLLAANAIDRREPGVYFLAAAGFIKIGYANHVPERLKNLQTYQLPCPSEVLHVERCDTAKRARLREHIIHQRFWSIRFRGEWFHDRPELRAFISDLKAQAA